MSSLLPSRRRGINPRQTALVAAGIVVLAMVAGPLMIASASTWASAILTTLVFVAAAVALAGDPREARTLVRSRAFVAVVLLGGVALVQVLPLPCSWVGALSPVAARAHEATSLLLTEKSNTCTISMAAGSSDRRLLEHSAWICAAVVVVALQRRKLEGRLVDGVLVAIAVTLAVTILHVAFDAHSVFGVYVPSDAVPRFMGPILNDNHLGAFLGAGVPLLLGRAADRRESTRRWAWSVAAAVLALTAFATLSRSSVLGVAVGVALFFSAYMKQRRKLPPMPLVAPFAALGLLCLTALLIPAVRAAVRVAVSNGALQKLDVIGRGTAFAFGAPWIGNGRGAFGDAFAAFFGTTTRFQFAENFWVQWSSDFGVVVATVLCVALVGALGRAVFSQARSLSGPSAAAAALGWLAHDLFDFSLEMAGLGLAFVVLVLVAVARDSTKVESKRARTPRNSQEQSRSRPGFLSQGFVASFFGKARARGLGALAVLVIAASSFGGAAAMNREDWRIEQSLSERLARPIPSGAAFEKQRAELAAMARLYPRNPAVALYLGSYARRSKHLGEGLRWLTRAMVLAPGWASPHAEAAATLLELRRVQQAWFEVGEAARRELGVVRPILCRLLTLPSAKEHVFEQLPQGREMAYLEMASACAPAPLAALLDEAIIVREPHHTAARQRQIRRLHAAGDRASAIEAARKAVAATPRDGTLVRVLCDQLIQARQCEEALGVLDKAAAGGFDGPPFLQLRARAAAACGKDKEMRGALQKLQEQAGVDSARSVEILLLTGQLETSVGSFGRAHHAFVAASRLELSERALIGAANAATSLGNRVAALSALRDLVRLAPDNVAYKNRLHALESELFYAHPHQMEQGETR